MSNFAKITAHIERRFKINAIRRRHDIGSV